MAPIGIIVCLIHSEFIQMLEKCNSDNMDVTDIAETMYLPIRHVHRQLDSIVFYNTEEFTQMRQFVQAHNFTAICLTMSS